MTIIRKYCKDMELYIDGYWDNKVFHYKTKEWTLLFDLFTEATSANSHAYSRIRAPFISIDDLSFKLYRNIPFFSTVEKLLGMQDIIIQDKELDDEFIIQGNNEEKITRLLNDNRVKKSILSTTNEGFTLYTLKKDDFSGQKLPKNVKLLQVLCREEIFSDKKNYSKQDIKGRLKLVSLVLEKLVEIGSASQTAPDIKLK